jgi:ADP-heptose:LPS heptosyltransferase
MIKLPIIHFDCKHFIGDRPCFPNKLYGVFCGNCTYYEKDKNITGVFPEINQFVKNTPGYRKIIIVKLDAAGDVLRTTSILPSLKDKYPDSTIVWITKKKSSGILSGNKFINKIFFNTDNVKDILSEQFDIAINLDTGTESCTIMNRINAVERFGYTLVNSKPYPVNSLANEWYLMGIDDNFKKQNKKTYHQIIHEISALDYKNSKPLLGISDKEMINAAVIKEKYGLHNFQEFILINLGGGNRWQYKKWTKEGYADLINKLSYLKPNSAIGAVAGMEDIDFYNEVIDIVNKKDNVILFGCNNSTEDFINIIFLADKIFTSDSLAFHIATALGKYTVVIVGPTSHSELDVFGSGKIMFSSKVDCLVCYLNKCSKTVTCMNTVNAGDVLKNLL